MNVNPAQRLLEIFESWEATDIKSIEGRRWLREGVGDPLQTHIEAIICLREIEAWIQLRAAEGINVQRRTAAWTYWAQKVFNFRHGWQDSYDMQKLDLLESIAENMQSDFNGLTLPDPERLRVQLAFLREAVSQDGSLDHALRVHMLKLIAHLQACIESWETQTAFSIHEACRDLRAYCDSAAVRTTSDKWRAVFQTGAIFVAQETASFAYGVLAGAGVKAITGG